MTFDMESTYEDFSFKKKISIFGKHVKLVFWIFFNFLDTIALKKYFNSNTFKLINLLVLPSQKLIQYFFFQKTHLPPLLINIFAQKEF